MPETIVQSINYYGIFRKGATMPINMFAVRVEAEQYYNPHTEEIKMVYAIIGELCETCGGLTQRAADGGNAAPEFSNFD